MVDALRSEHRNVALARKFRHRAEPDVLVRIVLVREHRADFEAVPAERFDSGASDVMVRKYNTFHG
ncbi:hypothetical protein SDC9_169439 [bioreactor metagenome]|uniref:Uncharacterized protein n=1 Tax=bioreactor metagenome TaxID=1076179 RepID=A0A645G7D9_9ZZZZ